ncbi:MAG: M28 family peptidase [Methanobacterium sp.]|nr:M28 family peptidase [Methanobacterium sp.]
MDFEKTIISLTFIILMTFFFSNMYNNESLDMSMVDDIKYICNEIGPRPAGSLQEQNVALYLQSRFNDYGVSNEIQEFRYYSMNKTIKKSRNIIGTINGTSKKQIIICADLDTYGNKTKDNYTQGANDDTATLSILITLAEHYKDKKPYYTIINWIWSR